MHFAPGLWKEANISPATGVGVRWFAHPDYTQTLPTSGLGSNVLITSADVLSYSILFCCTLFNFHPRTYLSLKSSCSFIVSLFIVSSC